MTSRRGPKTPRRGGGQPGGTSPSDGGAVRLYDVPLGGTGVVVLSFEAPREPLPLTSAERIVAMLAAEGLSTLAIASRRGTSLRTVSNQLASIYEKLGVQSRVELAARLTEAWE
jgi:DNA-binding CsgD family transcriptional regulator